MILLLLSSWSVTASIKLNGAAVYGELGREDYLIALYSDKLSTNPQTLLSWRNWDRRLDLHVLADNISSRRFVSLWQNNLAINTNDKGAKFDQYLIKFYDLIRQPLKQGDVISLYAKATADKYKRGIVVYKNQKRLGAIYQPSIYSTLMRVWLGELPVSRSVKAGLSAGGKDLQAVSQERLDILNASNDLDLR